MRGICDCTAIGYAAPFCIVLGRRFRFPSNEGLGARADLEPVCPLLSPAPWCDERSVAENPPREAGAAVIGIG